MTEEDKRNELTQLSASWMNTLATAIITAGTFVPMGQWIFGILPNAPGVVVGGTAIVCVIGGISLHFIGRAILGSLE